MGRRVARAATGADLGQSRLVRAGLRLFTRLAGTFHPAAPLQIVVDDVVHVRSDPAAADAHVTSVWATPWCTTFIGDWAFMKSPPTSSPGSTRAFRKASTCSSRTSRRTAMAIVVTDISGDSSQCRQPGAARGHRASEAARGHLRSHPRRARPLRTQRHPDLQRQRRQQSLSAGLRTDRDRFAPAMTQRRAATALSR